MRAIIIVVLSYGCLCTCMMRAQDFVTVIECRNEESFFEGYLVEVQLKSEVRSDRRNQRRKASGKQFSIKIDGSQKWLLFFPVSDSSDLEVKVRTALTYGSDTLVLRSSSTAVFYGTYCTGKHSELRGAMYPPKTTDLYKIKGNRAYCCQVYYVSGKWVHSHVDTNQSTSVQKLHILTRLGKTDVFLPTYFERIDAVTIQGWKTF